MWLDAECESARIDGANAVMDFERRKGYLIFVIPVQIIEMDNLYKRRR